MLVDLTGDPAAAKSAAGTALTRARMLGAPSHLPAASAGEFLRFAEASVPNIFRHSSGGVFLERRKNADNKFAIDKDAYAFYFSPRVEDDGALNLACRVGYCDARVDYETTASGKRTFPFSNALAHLKTCSFRPLLTIDDTPATPSAAKKAAKAASSASASAGAGGGASGAKRGAGATGVIGQAASIEEHLEVLGMSEKKYRLVRLEQALMDGQPLAFGERPGELLTNRALLLPKCPETTMRRMFQEHYDRLVTEPALGAIAAHCAPLLLKAGGYEYEMRNGITTGADGVKLGPYTSESLIGHFAKECRSIRTVTEGLFTKTMPGNVRLEREAVPLAVGWWEIGKYGKSGSIAGGSHYTVGAHADFLIKLLAPFGITPEMVRRWLMDTTNGNPAVLKEEAWQHALYVACLQHILSLTVLDFMEVRAFADAHSACHELNMYIKSTPKRFELYKRSVLPGDACITPKAFSKTRFLSHLITMASTLQNMRTLASLNSNVSNASASNPLFLGLPAYEGLYAKVVLSKPVLEVVKDLAPLFEQCSKVLGGSSTYTTGRNHAIFEVLWNKSKELCSAPKLPGGEDHPHAALRREMGISLQNSLLERIATHHVASALFNPAVHKRPSFLEAGYPAAKMIKKIEEDSRQFAAMIVNPVNFPYAIDRCPDGFENDVAGYLYTKIIAPGATLVGDGPAVAPVSSSRAALSKEVAAINARTKPLLMGADLFAAQQAADVEAAKARFRTRGEQVDAEGEAVLGSFADRKQPLLEKLGVELAEHVQFLKEEAMNRRAAEAEAAAGGAGGASAAGAARAGGGAAAAARRPAVWTSRFGHPLSNGTDACYEHWPSVKVRQPLLYFCVRELLAGDSDATTDNERLHVPAQRIACKARSGLKPTSIEQLTLACAHIRKRVADELRTTTSEQLDLAEMQAEWDCAAQAQAEGGGAAAGAAAGAGAAAPDAFDDGSEA